MTTEAKEQATDQDEDGPLDPKPARRDLLSTGSTLLNLALTDNPFGGFPKGKYIFIVGDSNSGKTFLSMTCFAEATISRHFKDYRLIYDNGEDGMLMDLDTLFNEAVADKIEAPSRDKDGGDVFSITVEDFYYHLDDAIFEAGWDTSKNRPSGKTGRPFIYVLDSQDSLTSEAEGKKFHEHKKAYRKRQGKKDEGDGGKEEKLAGSYGDGKAKKHSEYLRKAMRGLRETGSILIIIGQTRDDIGAMFAGAKTRSGGRSLKFYATAEFWSAPCGSIKKTVLEKVREVGNKIRIKVTKNRITGKRFEVELDIYPSYGIDDLGTCVDYLIEEGQWTKSDQTITCEGLQGVSGTRDKVIRMIEKRGLENEVRALCGKVWKQVADACALKRKNRYADTNADGE